MAWKRISYGNESNLQRRNTSRETLRGGKEMKLLVILIALMMLCLILIAVAAVTDSPTLGQYAVQGLLISFIGFVVTGVTIGVCTPNPHPTALDVYRGKTTLEITYRNSVAVDSVVVYKMK